MTICFYISDLCLLVIVWLKTSSQGLIGAFPSCIAANAPDVQSEYETGGPKWRCPSESPTWNVRNVRAIQVNLGHPATLSKETEKRKNGEREKHKVLKLVELDQDHGQQSDVLCVVHFQMSRWQSLQSKVLSRQN